MTRPEKGGAEKITGLILLLACVGSGGLAGCSHSRMVTVSVVNSSSQTLSNIVVDYPAATFGISALAPGKTFQYRIQPSAAGTLQIEFRDAQGKTRKYPGPSVWKDEEGGVEIRLTQDAVR